MAEKEQDPSGRSKGLPLLARLTICGSLCLALTISEFLLNYYTHSITLLVLANHSFYNVLTLGFGATSIVVSVFKSIQTKSLLEIESMNFVYSKALALKCLLKCQIFLRLTRMTGIRKRKCTHDGKHSSR